MKSRYAFNSQSRSAMLQEIKRQVKAQEEELVRSVDAMVLWTLHTELGFGKKRLERFYKKIIQNYNEMCEFYLMNDAYPAKYKLREMGVDLDKLRKESV